MQSRPSYDTSFAEQFQWSEPDRDLGIVRSILAGHYEGKACPAEQVENYHVLRLLAGNPVTPAEVLDHLAICVSDVRILERVATNPKSSTKALTMLARHNCNDIRSAVAENSNADIEIITLLAQDGHIDVRYRLAESHDLPGEILESLCEDENPYVANRAQMTRTRVLVSRMPSGITEDFPKVDNRYIRRAV